MNVKQTTAEATGVSKRKKRERRGRTGGGRTGWGTCRPPLRTDGARSLSASKSFNPSTLLMV
jgi:hypothetical protein